MKNTFINASINRHGRTAKLATEIFKEQPYQVINLVDFQIDQLGRISTNDELEKVLEILSGSDNLVIGTPVYWYSMSGHLKAFVDRLGNREGNPENQSAPFTDSNLYLIVQGAFPPEDVAPSIINVFQHLANRFNINYKQCITNEEQAKKIIL